MHSKTAVGTSQARIRSGLENFVFSKSLMIGLSYSYDWGFIPSTLAEDGDPLDAMIIHGGATVPGLVLLAACVFRRGVAFKDEARVATQYRSWFPPLAEPMFMTEVQKVEKRDMAIDPKMLGAVLYAIDFRRCQHDEKVLKLKHISTSCFDNRGSRHWHNGFVCWHRWKTFTNDVFDAESGNEGGCFPEIVEGHGNLKVFWWYSSLNLIPEGIGVRTIGWARLK